MAIYYCSWATGNDTTGDGTYGNPYKTITTASTGRSGGDEVRVEKSPEPTALTGTLTFTAGSANVSGSGTAFTTELVIGDFIEADGNWWEVITLTSATACVLYKVFGGTTQTGITSRKLGVTSTGAAAASTTQIQIISASGTSAGSMLSITGGWDLSTQTQTGQTWFRQMHGTFANRYGYGLYVLSKGYFLLDKLNFLRYNYGVHSVASTNSTFTAMTCNSNAMYGLYLNTNNTNNTIGTVTCNSNNDVGLRFASASNSNTITTATCISNASYGIELNASLYNTITTATCTRNVTGIFVTTGSNGNVIGTATCNNNTYGIFFVSSLGNAVITATCNNNVQQGIRIDSNNNRIGTATCNTNGTGIYYTVNAANSTINSLTTTGNTTSALAFPAGTSITVCTASIAETTKVAALTDYSNGRLNLNNIGGYSEIWTDGGNIISQAATAGGTGKEWRFNVTSANRKSNYPLSMKVAAVAVAANAQVTVTVYFKKSATSIAGRLLCRGGQLAGVASDVSTTCPDDTSRNNVQIQFTPTEAGVIEIEAEAWYVSATDQNVIIDDIAITQA